jgi:hypothetical protein
MKIFNYIDMGFKSCYVFYGALEQEQQQYHMQEQLLEQHQASGFVLTPPGTTF